MPTCFVMQPFDGAEFDARYNEVYEPAIRAAGLEPYRVDRDAGSVILIQSIETGIKDAAVCFADISLDNPNVWFELGYAISAGKEVIMVCSKTRAKFPFDIQHRLITRYATASPKDFDALKATITERLEVALRRAEKVATLEDNPIRDVQGMASHEVAVMAVLGASTTDEVDPHMSIHYVRREAEKLGFTAIAASIAIRSLTHKRYLRVSEEPSEDGPYPACSLTGDGWDWIVANSDRFLVVAPKKEPKGRKPAANFEDMGDDNPS